MEYKGELVAIIVSILWTISAVLFETASKRMGSIVLNVIRMTLTIMLIGIYTTITKGMFLPTDAGRDQLIWLSLSGFLGLFVGDLFLFRAYSSIGARTSQLVMSVAPVMTALIGLMILGEKLTTLEWCGITITTSGILTALLGKQGEKIKLNTPAKGLAFATVAMVCQAVGYIMTKKGMIGYDAFSGSQIRAISAMFGLIILVSIKGMWGNLKQNACDKISMKNIALGTVCGPFLGISLSLYAIANSTTGIAATLMALVPILIIVPSIVIKKEKITKMQIAGTVISVAGGCLFFV